MDWTGWEVLLMQFCIVALCLTPMVLLLLPHVGRHEWLEELLRPLAQGGIPGARIVVVNDGPMPMPILLAPCAGRSMTVSPDPLVDDERPGAVLIEVIRYRSETVTPRVELVPRASGGARRFPGLTTVDMPPALARGYQAQGGDATRVAAMLLACEAALRSLTESVDGVEVSISANARRLLIRKLRRPRDADEMRLVVACVDPIARALLGEREGDGTADRETGDIAPLVCIGCGSPGPDVSCRACQSPYHAACFPSGSNCLVFPCVAQNARPLGDASRGGP